MRTFKSVTIMGTDIGLYTKTNRVIIPSTIHSALTASMFVSGIGSYYSTMVS